MTRSITAAVLALMLCAGAAAAQSAPKGSAPEAVNLNTATLAQLETLPGIGPATAQRIVEYRQKSGGFKRIEELMNVRGIGEASFLKIKPLVSITPPKGDRAAAESR
jgi:competence protein ComEA